MAPQNGSFLKWLRTSLFWSIRGIGAFFRSERNARIEGLIAFAVIIAGVVFDIDRFEWIAVTIAIGLVLAAEAFNTSLESLADAVHPDQHPLVGRAKDIAAGAVLIAAIAATVIGLIVFLPKALEWLTH